MNNPDYFPEYPYGNNFHSYENNSKLNQINIPDNDYMNYNNNISMLNVNNIIDNRINNQGIPFIQYGSSN